MPARKRHYNNLLDDFGHNTSADGTTAFTDGKTQTIFHRNGFDQCNGHLNVITWHHHLNTFWQLAVTSHISRTEVELRTITLEEWRMTTTLLLAQNVNLSSELGMRLDGARLDQNLATLNIITLGTTQQNAAVLASDLRRAACGTSQHQYK